MSTVDSTEQPVRTRPWQLVAQREVVVKLTDKTFLLSTAGLVVLIVVGLAVQAYFGSRTQTFEVAATPDARAMAASVARAAPGIDDKVRVEVVATGDAAAARSSVRDGDADAWLARTPDGWRLTSLRAVDSDLQSVTTQAVRATTLERNAADAGTSVGALTQDTRVSTAQLEGDAARSDLAQALGFVMAILFYLGALLFGITLAQSVVEEKQSRIVEIIVTSIPVPQLLAGKIVGNTVLALAQLLVLVTVGVVGLSFTEYASVLPAVSLGIGWFLLFFVAGFVVIATMYAVAGALASRTEDVQATSTPATTLVMVVFFASFVLDGPAKVVASYLPPVSALLMPMRVVSGEAQWWEPLVALALLLVTAAAVLRLGTRVYRRSLLQTSGRLSLKKAWTVET